MAVGSGWAVEPWTRFASPVDAGAFAVEQVFYPSTDGTDVPMFLVRASGTGVTADTPTLLTAYGGFAITNTPGYSPSTVAFCEAGGVWAVAGIRGGGEYGEDWHRAGMLATSSSASTTSMRQPIGSLPKGGRVVTAWPSGAGRTAGCW